MLDRAEGKHRVVVIEAKSRTHFADAPRADPVVLRVARCVVPDDDAAVSMLAESLARIEDRADARWEGVSAPEQQVKAV